MKILTASNNPSKYQAAIEVYGNGITFITKELDIKHIPFLEDEDLVSSAKNKCNEMIAYNKTNNLKADKIIAIEGGYLKNNTGYYMIDVSCKYEKFKYNYGFSNMVRISKYMYEVAKMGKLGDLVLKLSGNKDITLYISEGITDGKKGFMESLIRNETAINTHGKIESLTVKDFSDTKNYQALESECIKIINNA